MAARLRGWGHDTSSELNKVVFRACLRVLCVCRVRVVGSWGRVPLLYLPAQIPEVRREWTRRVTTVTVGKNNNNLKDET